MVLAQMDSMWVPKEILPCTFEVTGLEEIKETIKNRPYTYYRLALKAENGRVYTYDAKFKDKNYMVNTYGPDTDDWLGSIVVVEIDPETSYKRLVSVRL